VTTADPTTAAAIARGIACVKPDSNHAATTVTTPPTICPTVKMAITERCPIGPRQPGEVSMPALFKLQVEPASACPAIRAVTTHADVATPASAVAAEMIPTTATTGKTSRRDSAVRRLAWELVAGSGACISYA
jgi:hypothetical protein